MRCSVLAVAFAALAGSWGCVSGSADGGSEGSASAGTRGNTAGDPSTTERSTGAEATVGSTPTSLATTGECTSDGCPSSDSTSGDPGPQTETNCGDQRDEDADGRIDCFDDDCWSVQSCEERFVRVATWNVLEVGAPASPGYDALVAVLRRIDADIVCLQEIGDDEDENLEAARLELGYSYWASAPSGRGAGGMIRNACLSRFEIVQWDALDSRDLSSDPAAADMTRAILRARVYLEPLDRYLTLLNVHLKAGVQSVDRFRRMVEAARLGRAIALEREAHPGNGILVLGDFNEEVDHGLRQTFDVVPPGVPFSYRLGNDIVFPLQYVPFVAVGNEGVRAVPALVEDSVYDDTYLPSLVKLDYLYEDVAPVVASEVYEACEDDGEDSPPLGDVLPKVGEPLACGANGDASDHRPVVAVFYFP